MKTIEDYRNHLGQPDVASATVDAAIALQSISHSLKLIHLGIRGLRSELYDYIHQGDSAKGAEGPAEYTEGDARLEEATRVLQEGREARDAEGRLASEGQEGE